MELPDPFDLAADSLSEADLGLWPKVVPYSTLKPTRVNWLWPGRFPCGKLALFDGDPDTGKSNVVINVAARLTTGSPMPDGYMPDCPVNVLFLRGEDGAADTVLPRLLAAGGDPARFMELEGVPELTNAGKVTMRPPELPTDLYWLDRVITELQIAMVLVDPLMAFLSEQVSANKDQSVRRALSPLSEVAQRTGACVCAVRHLNKQVGAPSLYRGGGSIGLLAAARVVLVAGHDPSDSGRRLFGCYKNNLGPKCETLMYRLIGDDLHDCSRVEWMGASDRAASDVLHLSYVDEDERAAADEAVAFLFEALAGGGLPAAEVFKQARQAGVGEKALEKAKRVAGIVVEREKGKAVKDTRWLWRLPDPDTFEFGDDPHGQEPDDR
jgi:hypothetical protein